MTGTGAFPTGGIVDFAPSLYGAGDDPADAVILRDGVYHGTHHAADSFAQVRVNYQPVASGVAQDQDSYETHETASSTSDWVQVGGSPFGKWPLSLRADGSGYKLRVRIAGAMSATADTATFRVVLGPPRRLSEPEIEASLDSTFEAVATNTTIQYLSGSSQGDDNSGTVLTVTRDQARDWTRGESIYNAVSSPTGGHTVDQCLVSAHVYVRTTDVTNRARLHALHVAEYVG